MPNRIRRVVGLGWQDEDGDDVTIVRSGEELVVGIVVTPSSDGVRVAVDVGDSIPVRVDVRHRTSTGAELAWSSERAEVASVLREVCRDHGDLDWGDRDHLADVVTKHLGDYLSERR